MAWWKNGLLLAAGGAVGLIAGALLYEAVLDEKDYSDDDDDLPERDGISLLAEKIRIEASAAMDACETEEEREAVYAQVKDAVHEMQEKLAQKGEEIIEQLKERTIAAAETAEESESGQHVKKVKDTLQQLTDSLDETLESLKPAGAEPAM